VHILQFIEGGNVFKGSLRNPDPDGRNGNNPTYSQWTPEIQNARILTYQCPSDPTGNPNPDTLARTSFAHNGQIFRHYYNWGGVAPPRYPAGIPDGTTATFMYMDGLRFCNSGAYNDRFWPDWGGKVYSSDYGDPPVLASFSKECWA
jgi:hypothetical protein